MSDASLSSRKGELVCAYSSEYGSARHSTAASRCEFTDAPACLVQIELQHNGNAWRLKGCTAYVSDGTRRPIPCVAQRFYSRAEAVHAMKRQARQDVASRHEDIDMPIRWQLVIWTPDWFVGSQHPRCDEKMGRPPL